VFYKGDPAKISLIAADCEFGELDEPAAPED
jgi:hypothetical protein